MEKRKNKVCLIALGCPKNLVEAENIAGIIKEKGFELTSKIGKAGIAVVHTCSFIEDARKESRENILFLSELKKKGKLEKIIVTGCMVQGEGDKIAEAFPEVDGFIGTGNLGQIPDKLEDRDFFVKGRPGGLLDTGKRILSSAFPSAYLRLAEGCNHGCRFCLIPRLRGKYKSRPLERLVAEAVSLAATGIKELVLVSQDTTFYGSDIYGREALSELLGNLSGIEGIRWIRVLYSHPGSLSARVLDMIANNMKLCKYLDMPVQHVSDSVLRSMGRPGGARKVVEGIKNRYPEIALRSTFITGYPGETQKDFKELAEFTRKGYIDELGVFEYSPHPGIAADNLSDAVKKSRREEIMLLQKEIVAGKNNAKKGRVFEVLVEKNMKGDGRKGFWKGRSGLQAPEIDSCIYFQGNTKPGEFVKVKIDGYDGYDLTGIQL